MPAYEAVIGLEVHAQLQTRRKAFCFGPSDFGGAANTRVGPVSAGLPGALPVLNQKVVELAVRAGLVCNCRIQERSVFSRKNYFYPDLPKGYQISQFDEPICGPGYLDISLENGRSKRVGIERIHIEEDAGKSFHLADVTLINLNRAGVPLVEIVSRPDLRGPLEASAYLRKLHALLVHAEICDGNLEEGNFRCDVNISVRPVGQERLGTRAEIKNINSFRFVEKAIDYEVARQIAVLDDGDQVLQETRGWDAAGDKTYSMRSKEDAHDYRYFPEPDLPPLLVTAAFVEKVRREMPELPDERCRRFVEQQGLALYEAERLTAHKPLADFFEASLTHGGSPKMLANWLNTELLALLKEAALDVEKSPLSPQRLSELVQLIENGTLSGKMAKSVLVEMFGSGQSAAALVETRGLAQVSDEAALVSWVDEVLATHSAQATEYREGKDKVLAFLVGQVMKLSRGKAHPPRVSELIHRKLRS